MELMHKVQQIPLIPRLLQCQGGRGGVVPWAQQRVGMAGLGSRCSTPSDKWHRAFPTPASTALWGMSQGWQKTIKKPLAGTAFAMAAPDTATGCTFTGDSGMQQPWSGKDSPTGHPGPAPALSDILFLFF